MRTPLLIAAALALTAGPALAGPDATLAVELDAGEKVPRFVGRVRRAPEWRGASRCLCWRGEAILAGRIEDNVTLTSKQFALQLKLFSGLVFVIATIAVLCTESSDSFWAQLQRALSMAIVASSFAFAGLYKWGWRWRPV